MLNAANSHDVIVGAAVALLIYAAVHDAAARTIPDGITLALAALGLVAAMARHSLLLSACLSACVFAAGMAAWSFRMTGGGDVKLLGVLALAVSPGSVLHVLFGTAIAGAVLAMVYLIAARFVPRPSRRRPRTLLARVARVEQWRIHRRSPLPYGVAIASGTFVAAGWS